MAFRSSSMTIISSGSARCKSIPRLLLLASFAICGVSPAHVLPAGGAGHKSMVPPSTAADKVVDSLKSEVLGADISGFHGSVDAKAGNMGIVHTSPVSHTSPHARTPPRVQRLTAQKTSTDLSPELEGSCSDETCSEASVAKSDFVSEQPSSCNAARPLVVEQPFVWLYTTLFEELCLMLICAPFCVLVFRKRLTNALRSLRQRRVSSTSTPASARAAVLSAQDACESPKTSSSGGVNYVQMTLSCVRAGDLARGEEWLLHMLEVGMKPEVTTFNVVIDACTKARRVSSAERWLLAMIDAGVKPDVVSYTTVIDACAKTGDVARSERWLGRMIDAGVHADVVSYNAVIDACAKGGDIRRADSWFKRMIGSGVEPNVISYTALIAACARKGDLHRAESLLNSMEGQGVKANVNSYSAVIDACAKLGNASCAEKWLSRMGQAGVEADVVCFNALINACAKAGDAMRAEAWLLKMLDAGMDVNVISYNAVIDACAKARDVDRAEKWLLQMVKCGVEVNVICYNAVINACARVGDVARAERWLDELIRSGIKADAISYNAVIDACAKAGDVARARSVFARMKTAEVQPTVVTYTSLAAPLSKRGEHEQVESIMEEMLAAGCGMNSYFLNILLCAYGNATPKQATKAESAFRSAIAGGVEINEFIVNSLKKCLGGGRSIALIRDLGLTMPAPNISSVNRRNSRPTR